MKTTVELSDPLAREARRVAARDGITLRELIEVGLRRVLDERGKKLRFRLRKASFRGRGLQPEFRSAPWERILDAAYEDPRGRPL